MFHCGLKSNKQSNKEWLSKQLLSIQAISDLGYIDFVPGYAQAGNLVCVLSDAATPYVLRLREPGVDARYELVDIVMYTG